MSILIKNAWKIVTMNQKDEILTGHSILIEGNKIKKIAPEITDPVERVINGKNLVVIPGMINTHHHLYQTLFRNIPLVQNSKLFDWLINLYEAWREIDEESVYYGALVGLGELLLTGCTCSTDHHYLFPKKAGPQLIDAEIKAAAELGIRFYPTRGSMTLSKKDGGLPPDDVIQTEEVILADCARLIRKYHDPKPFAMTRINLSPCSPFSITTRSLRETAEFARKHKKVLLHTHIAETIDEEQFCLQKFGKRPVDYMESVGWLGPDVWFAHCVHLNDREINKMAKTGTGVAHCPTSNMRLGSGIAPVPQMLKAGVPVSMAVDGSASNDSSDMLGELRQCLLSHRVKWGVDSITAYDTLKIATQGGAGVFQSPELGRLEPGSAADLAAFDLNRIWYAGSSNDPVAALVFAGASHVARYTIVNGKIVVENGKLVNIREASVTKKANRLSEKMIEKASRNTGIKFA
ncbi:MAG: 8-oxoguanine deaminase [Candidatus Wallbacteria bacterium]|nr:8-oxoguanine deaminase [Candidatus Wallbacteria bacterium]